MGMAGAIWLKMTNLFNYLTRKNSYIFDLPVAWIDVREVGKSVAPNMSSIINDLLAWFGDTGLALWNTWCCNTGAATGRIGLAEKTKGKVWHENELACILCMNQGQGNACRPVGAAIDRGKKLGVDVYDAIVMCLKLHEFIPVTRLFFSIVQLWKLLNVPATIKAGVTWHNVQIKFA